MFNSKPSLPSPRTLACPHCRSQMNLTGRGRGPGSTIYCCSGCVAMLRMKELWLGQVVRTGAKGFGFVQLQGPDGASLRFNTSDFLDSGSPQAASPRVGEPVLVLLSDDACTASKVWKLRNGAHARNADASPSPRHRGTITAVKSPDWGFLTDEKAGQAYFVHRTDLVGGCRLVVGQRVTFLPVDTPKGKKAGDVRIVVGR